MVVDELECEVAVPGEMLEGYGQDQRVDQDRTLVIRPGIRHPGRCCPKSPTPFRCQGQQQ